MPSGERRGGSALSVKICLAGDMAVGKSSLLRRFVTNTFDDKYVSTLGAKVGSRKFSIPDPRHPGQVVEVGASIWDLMGNAGFREVLKEAYFHGAKGVMLVCDGTRPETFRNLPSWIKAVQTVAGNVPAIVLMNKSDLAGAIKVTREAIEAFCEPRGCRWLPTSAKTGENVAEAFDLMASVYLESLKAADTEVTANP